MKRSRPFAGFALNVLVLTIAGFFSHSTYAATPPQQPDQEKAITKQNSVTAVENREVLLASSSSPAASSSANPTPLPPAPSAGSSYRWSGFYVGINGGYIANRADTSFVPLPGAVVFVNLANTGFNPDPRGVIGGLQTGYNWESGSGAVVLGVEADFSATNASGTAFQSPIIQNNGTPFPGSTTTGGNRLTARQSTNWIATVRPRFGTAILPRWFVYATGGLAFGHVSDSADSDFRPAGTEHYPISIHKTNAGWTAGAGSEIGIGQRWSFKTEYLYYNLGKNEATANPSIPFSPGSPNYQVHYKWAGTGHIARAGINFRF